MAELQIYTIDTFKGVNKSETETLLELGEASYMTNWMITDDNKLQKQFGYERLNDPTSDKVTGIWHGQLNGNDRLLFARGGKVYEHITQWDGDIDEELGIIADSYPTTFFVTNNIVYIMDGTDLYQWDGDDFKTVAGYVPTAFTAVPPTGGGTILEGLNYLTGKKKMKFSGNGSATVFQLPELSIGSVDKVVVGVSTKAEGPDYSVNKANGTITFVTAPPNGVNNVEVSWTKTDPEHRQLITKCKHYGGQYYARFWIYGNPDQKNTRFCSGVTMAGVSDPTYWPMYTESDVGEHEITAITTQYDKQLIWTTGDSGGASAWYSTSETYIDSNSGIMGTLFPVFPINAKVGNMAPGQVQIILNNPFTIWKGVYQWVSTYVMNEKNAEWISKRIQRDLDPLDLTKAITWDWDDKGLYLLCIGKKVWVYNYRVDAWYILDLPHEPTCFMTVGKKLLFGTTDGQIMRFSEDIPTYDGEIIEADWHMGFYHFGAEWLRKFVQRVFVSILPLVSTHVDVTFQTDMRDVNDIIKARYKLSSFDDWDFSDFSFETNYSPQPFKFKIRAKKIDYFKLKISNKGTDGAVVLSITLPVRIGGEVKNRS
ncbi:MAG TPA: DUF2460 domain-containing protein [Firmicutes bacterium]|nr:DUF2460 domain-containing protein [Bacillota bacterium]